jgi:chromate transporter
MASAAPAAPDEGGVAHTRGAALRVFLAALRLGLTSFGGPIAHIGYFREEYVVRRRWLDEHEFGDLVALAQVLPGPASSQLGVAIGMRRAGLAGGLLAWLGFTLPSAVLMIAFAAVVDDVDTAGAGWVAGLKIAAVAVVAQAVWSMARSLAPDLPRGSIAIAAAVVLLAVGGAGLQVAVIAGGAIAGRALGLGAGTARPAGRLPVRASRTIAIGALVLFAVALAGLPVLDRATESHAVAMSDAYYRSGALVFGGGHVVLPLLEERVVPTGWVPEQQFLAGYGAAQALPGPLFTFAGYLGAVQRPEPNGVPGGVLALCFLFLPAMLLVVGVMPFWDRVRAHPAAFSALAGVNAAVVGVLFAALYDPVATSAIRDVGDAALALAAFALLVLGRAPPVAVVAGCALVGAVLL